MQTSTSLASSPSAQSAAMAASRSAHPAGTLESSALLQGAKTVSIVHNGAIYRLQATKLGKLILTK